MNRRRSVLVLIIVPAAVSLLVTLLVLYLWDRQQKPQQSVIVLPTHSGTSLIPPRSTQPPPPSTEDGTPGEEVAEVTPEPTIAPDCENPYHVVAAGETLSTIAEQYGLLIDDVVAMNRMLNPEFDPDYLSVGQQLVIPICGVPTPTPSPMPTATTRIIPTPLPAATEPPPGTVIVRIARVLNSGDITSEAVEIINEGTSVARLEDWVLTNGRGDEFVFPALNLFPQGAVTIHTGVGQNTAIDLYWGLTEAVWEIGDIASLLDAAGEVQDELEVTD